MHQIKCIVHNEQIFDYYGVSISYNLVSYNFFIAYELGIIQIIKYTMEYLINKIVFIIIR